MKAKSTIDTRPERDPRYVAAKARQYELQAELARAEKERSNLQDGIQSLASRAKDRLAAEAQALLSGEQAPEVKKRQQLTDSLGEVEHRIAVLREAIVIQRDIVAGLTSEISRMICADVKPIYRDRVRASINVALALEEASRAERELRHELISNGVQFTAHLRPMPIPDFNLSDRYGWLARFLFEAEEFGFITASELPASLRAYLPSRTKPEPKSEPKATNDGWLNAA